MSGFVGYALKGLKAGATKVAQKISGQKKLTGKAINKMPVARDLKKTRDLQDDLVDYRTKLFKGPFVTEETKTVVKTKNPLSQYLRKQNMNMKKPLAKGGRVGLKAGTNPFKRKTNIDKIKETFAPKKRINAKGGFPDLSGDGKTTFKDILIGRGVIKKKNGKTKKKVI
jgi:hypothetical protein